MRTLLRGTVLTALLALTACATSNTALPGSAASDRNSLSREEIVSVGTTNLHDVIARLRPQFLRGRGASSIVGNFDRQCNNGQGCYGPDRPEVYLDRAHLGGIDLLRTINTETVENVLFITGADTQIQFGMNHPGGVIHVISRT